MQCTTEAEEGRKIVFRVKPGVEMRQQLGHKVSHDESIPRTSTPVWR